MDSNRLFGHVDIVSYDPASGELHIAGWTWSDQSRHAASSLKVFINAKHYTLISSESVGREDVKIALDLETSKVGFAGKLNFDGVLYRGQEVKIVAEFPNGEFLEISGVIAERTLLSDKKFRRHFVLLVLIVTLIGISKFHIFTRLGSSISNWIQYRPRSSGAFIWAIFFILVACGITGSSWELQFQGASGAFGSSAAEVSGGVKQIFDSRSIRSDEWGVLTSNVLAQWNHVPSFPVINTNIGLDGQNMGVIGMTGVPIAQPAALARPATWGHFFLPLRQALSWQWQFPFFACLFVLWKTLNLIRPRNSAFNLSLAGLYCIAPYAVAWSFWPLYAAFFPLAAFVCLADLMRTKNTCRATFVGGAIGILLAGWILILYPPWQVSIGTFCFTLAAGWLLDSRNSIQLTRPQFSGFFAMIAVSMLLMGSWWLDTSTAVDSIQTTIYPGQRNALSGGDMSALWALRGYTNPEALMHGTGNSTNSSEISSYILFPLSIFSLGVLHSQRRIFGKWVLRAIMAFIVFCLVFWFVGIPVLVAKLTLWSSVPSGRLDPALALAATVVFAVIYRPKGVNSATKGNGKIDWLAGCVAVLGAGLAFFSLRLTPDVFSDTHDLFFAGTIALAVLAGTWWMMRCRMPSAVAMLLLLSGVSTFAFNPISRAPTSLKPSSDTIALASDSASVFRPSRTLVIGGGGLGPMALAATGIPTINGVFYYPQLALWKNIDLPEKDWPLVNRYQHLGFRLGELPPGTAYEVSNPRLDVVDVTVDPLKFNFAQTGASRIAALENDVSSLRKSPYLKEIGAHRGLYWFKVVRP